ncbi:MAG TPA: hypothetical protein VFB65_10880 [Pyrinomonadaceae bacterium]|nr:hypothetical protein [Pyrinomonadaceae bacterium]
MPLRPGNPFYFLFSPDDQSQIDPLSLVVTDVPFSANPQVADPYPQSLQIQFSLKSGGRTPKLRPLGPGLITFHFDPQPGLQPPEPKDAIPENYNKWPTVGRLRLTFKDPNVIERIQQITGQPVAPSDVWYSDVKITSNFLFETLSELPIEKVIADKKSTVPPKTPEGMKQIVSGFLKGRLCAMLTSGTQSSGDSQVAVEMPELAPETGSTFNFYITTGCARDPFDGEKGDYENPNNVTSDWEPAHPHNGSIPARLIYRNLRTHSLGNMIDADSGNAVPDRILATAVQRDGVPEYYPIRFTRIWKPEEDCSVHFPSQVVKATHVQTGREVLQRLPAHGLLFLSLTRLESLGGARFSIEVQSPAGKPEREMRWLAGGVADIWQDAAADAPVEVDAPAASQTVTGIPHIQMRRRMGQEIIYDRRHRPEGFGASCTFFSLRRTVRALVNNRIAGGRLNFEVYYLNNRVRGENSAATRKLVIEAIGSDEARVVLNGKPNHRAGEGLAGAAQAQAIGLEAVKLRPVLEKLFPRFVVPQDGLFPRPPNTAEGRVAYAVWQSQIDLFQADGTWRLFADNWCGGGGAAAIQVPGLAVDFVVNPGQTTIRQPGETDQSFRSRIVEDMLAGNLEPGAPLQFWDLFSDFDKIRARTVDPTPPTPGGLAREGHSPIFLGYLVNNGVRTGIAILDQTGVKNCVRTGTAGSYVLPWYQPHNPDVWLAANWME